MAHDPMVPGSSNPSETGDPFKRNPDGTLPETSAPAAPAAPAASAPVAEPKVVKPAKKRGKK